MTHAYEPDPHSGAGNCVCGAAQRHRRHPHVASGYRLTDEGVVICTCGLPDYAPIHRGNRISMLLEGGA